MEEKSIPVYEINQIPDQKAWHGFPLAFQIEMNEIQPGTLTLNTPQKPKGLLHLDASNGLFLFRPEESDKRPFDIIFTATKNDGKSVNQTIKISPIPRVLPERDYVRGKPIAPKATDSLYFKRTIKKVGNQEEHIISGVTIVIGGPEDLNQLHRYYHKDPLIGMEPINIDETPQISDLTICADRLVIHGSIALPKTNLHLYVRELVFEDDGDNIGQIITSPSLWSFDKAKDASRSSNIKAENGLHGLKAGDVHLNIDEIHYSNNPGFRFILRGGKGQGAGEGVQAENGHNVNSSHEYRRNYRGLWPFRKKRKNLVAKFNPPATYATITEYDGSLGKLLAIKVKDLPSIGSSDTEPKSATKGIAPGIPGIGGDAGAFYSNVFVPEILIDTNGGAPGKKAENIGRKTAGRPHEWGHYEVKVYATAPDPSGSWIEVKRTKKGSVQGFDRIVAQGAKEGNGTEIQIEEKPFRWMHPYLLQTLVQFLKDLYLADEIEAFEDVFSHYEEGLQAFEKVQAYFSPEEAILLNQTRTEILSLQHRIESHLDFYGNPIGWTPLFSLQTHMQLFENEVESALETLIATKWIQAYANEKEAFADALEFSITSLNEENDRIVSDLDKSKILIAKIEEDLSGLESELLTRGDELMKLREKLRVEAANDLRKKARINFAAKTLGAICQVIPVGQPVLGLVGSLAPIVADKVTNDDSEPLDTLGEGFGVIAKWTKGAGQESFKAWAGNVSDAGKSEDGQPIKDSKKASQKAQRINHVAKNIGPAIGQIGEAFSTLKVPASEVEAELDRLAAESPEYASLIQKIQKTMDRKTQVVIDLEEVLQILANSYATLVNNFSQIASFSHQKGAALATLDHQSTLFVQGQEQKARERLVKYQYYLIRAYEATVFRPYEQMDYRLPAIFDKLLELQDVNDQDPKSFAEVRENGLPNLKTVFRSVLKDIQDDLIADFTKGYTFTREFQLSSSNTEDIVKQLNEKGKATIDLMQLDPNFVLIPPNKEQVKIADIQVSEIQLESGAPTTGSLELTFSPLGDGTIRSNGQLFAVRHPSNSGLGLAGNTQFLWGANMSLSDGAIKPIHPSAESINLLRYLVMDSDLDAEALAKPAAWTKVEISFDRPLGAKLQSATLKFNFQFTPLNHDHYTVEVLTSGDLDPLILCSPVDVKDRADGFGDFYRIYPRSKEVQFDAPKTYGSYQFSHWRILNLDKMELESDVTSTTYKVGPNSNFRIACIYKSGDEIFTGLRNHRKMFADHSERNQKLFDQPSLSLGEPIALIPGNAILKPVGNQDLTKAEGLVWRKVNFNGLIGWVVNQKPNS